MANPERIIIGPLTLWVAPVGTAYPVLGAAPAAPWKKVGASGDKDYSDDGVTFSHPQSLEFIRTAGCTGPVKAARTEEDVKIGVTLLDMSLEMYKIALNDNAVSSVAAVAGVPGYKAVELARGIEVTQYAILARGKSAEDNTMTRELRVPTVVQSGEQEVAYKKGEGAGLELEFTAIENPDSTEGILGKLYDQTAVAL